MRPSLLAAGLLTALGVGSQAFAQDVLAAPYAKARESLIAMGAKPLVQERTETNSTNCVHADGDWCQRWPELMDCAGTGQGACVFLYRAVDGARIAIVTKGETDPRLVTVMPAQ